MIKIYFISTEGCSACEYFIERLVQVIINIKYRIDLQIGDFRSYPKEFIEYHNITDYPTTIISKDGKVVNTIVGIISYDKLKTLLTELFVE